MNHESKPMSEYRKFWLDKLSEDEQETMVAYKVSPDDESEYPRWIKVVEYSALTNLQKQLDELKSRLENALWFQEKSKTFISHFEDCNAITEPDELEDSGESCECGMDRFAYDNSLSIEISKSTLAKYRGQNG